MNDSTNNNSWPAVSTNRLPLVYGAMLLCLTGALAITWIAAPADASTTNPESSGSVASAAADSASSRGSFAQLLVALAAVLLAGQALAHLFARLGQPPVIGEVVAGLLLGPSLLGRVWPEAMRFLFPASVTPLLEIVSQLGVMLYMFVIGMELDLGQIRRHGGAVLAVAHAGIAAPFALGLLLALPMYSQFAPPGVALLPFALFLGVSLSVTAFPVLARILSDSNLQQSRLGTMALACAAAGDATAWCLLAVVVDVARSAVGGALASVFAAVAYVAMMVAVARPLLDRAWRRATSPTLSPAVIALAFLALLISALTTEALGLHAIFGAFLMGAVIPHDSPVARQLSRQLNDVVAALLLPAFFAFTGLRTEIGLVLGASAWRWCAAIILLATAGKMGGTIAAARYLGFDGRTAGALGILMNTRGLMELIVLNVGLDLGVISPELFAMLVVMAVATTLATAPLLYLTNSYPRSENSSSPEYLAR